ncbi:MAG TPA: ABC transporter substrate-binding protein [Acidobacteriota bacterium]|nr:ABC transporter substrate-binding protein [Acidobacteriota bacterium]
MKQILVGIAVMLILPNACSLRPERIRIGIALSEPSVDGIRLAARDINADGGIGGIPLELVGLDWKVQFDAVEILKWASRFAHTQDLVAVIGHSDSASTLCAAALYNQEQVPQIVTIATNPAITNIGKWTYRLCPSDTVQGPALAEYAVNDWGKKRIALFYVNDDYGRALASLFEKHAREIGGDIVASITYHNVLDSHDQELIRSTLKRMKNEGETDLIALFQRAGPANWTIRAIREAGISSAILAGDSLALPLFMETDPPLKEGIRIAHFFAPDPDDRRAAEFVRKFKAYTGKDPDYGSAFAYDALYLVRYAVLHGGYSRRGVKSSLDHLISDGTQVKGVAGSYALGADHDARRALYVAEVHNGHGLLLKTLRLSSAQSAGQCP